MVNKITKHFCSLLLYFPDEINGWQSTNKIDDHNFVRNAARQRIERENQHMYESVNVTQHCAFSIGCNGIDYEWIKYGITNESDSADCEWIQASESQKQLQYEKDQRPTI